MTLKRNIQLAIREMLKRYTDCDENCILAGYNNHVPTPSKNDYIVFSVLNPIRTGTPILRTTSTPYDSRFTSYQDFRITVQIDFYGEFAFDRANDIINISRTEVLCNFLEPYGVQPIAVDEAVNLTGASGEMEYVERWTINLEIDYRDAVSDEQEVFNTAKLNIFETEK